jgi:DNA-binding NtrC family response regulator
MTVQSDGSSQFVLVVDDDLKIRSYIKAVLQGADFQVLEASDGLEALEVFHIWRDRIDLVITDIRMPHVTGTDLALSLKSQHPALPLLFVSGESAPPGLYELVKGSIFVEKPFRPEALLDAVRRLLQFIPAAC